MTEKGNTLSLRFSILSDEITFENRITISIPKGIIHVLATITKNTMPLFPLSTNTASGRLKSKNANIKVGINKG
jgi:hypothetical protein